MNNELAARAYDHASYIAAKSGSVALAERHADKAAVHYLAAGKDVCGFPLK